MRELLYADDLLFIGESMEEIEEKWKKALHRKGLKINVAKTKVMIVAREKIKRMARVDPCALCGKRVHRNSIKCKTCSGWVHKKCSGIKGSFEKKDGHF